MKTDEKHILLGGRVMNELYISDSNKDVLRNLSEEYEEMYMVNYED